VIEKRTVEFLNHYRRPYLIADKIEMLTHGNGVVLRQAERALELLVDGNVEAAKSALELLCFPDSVQWSTMREVPDSDISTLVDALDRLGWLGEADQSGHAQITAEHNTLLDLLLSATNWLVKANDAFESSETGTQGSRNYLAVLTHFSKEARELWQDRQRYQRSLDFGRFMSLGKEDVAAQALTLVLRAWQRTSPLALQIVATAFELALRRLENGENRTTAPLDRLGITMSDAQDVANQVWAAVILLCLSATGEWRARYPQFIPELDLEGPGLRVLVIAETCAERLMVTLGRSPLLDVIENKMYSHRAAVGVYLHQYFMTIRYIEAILSFLRFRLRDPVRAIGFRYLFEEYGHEVYELNACRELGVPESKVLTFAPFPFFVAYPEILGLIAETDPLAFCLSITVAEGLPGVSKPIVDALAAQGICGESLSSHQEIDLKLDHALFTRKLLHKVPWIETMVARNAIRRFLFLVELSQLAWQQLARYAEATVHPLPPETFGLTPRDVLSLWGSLTRR
jgi:hypothetical protein